MPATQPSLPNRPAHPAFTLSTAPGGLASSAAAPGRDVWNEERRAQAECDQKLVDGLLRDDPRAWRLFNKRYSRVVLGCIHRVLSRFSRVTGEHDVDEIYARFCLSLLAHDKKKLRSYDPERGSKLSSWFGLLATHATYDYLRSLRRDSACEPISDNESLQSDIPSPFEASLISERARIAAELMTQLSERDQEFVELYFGEGIEPEVIAERMGISVKTVYSKKHKITARLESLLGDSLAAA